MAKKLKPRPIGAGAFDFASVGLAAGSGLLSMNAFAAYLDAMRPPKTKAKPRKSRVKKA